MALLYEVSFLDGKVSLSHHLLMGDSKGRRQKEKGKEGRVLRSGAGNCQTLSFGGGSLEFPWCLSSSGKVENDREDPWAPFLGHKPRSSLLELLLAGKSGNQPQ